MYHWDLFPPDTDGFMPQLQIPIITQSDQQQHMESAQWWVVSKLTESSSIQLDLLILWSHLVLCLCQQASLYRGGYNRFTPYWEVLSSKEASLSDLGLIWWDDVEQVVTSLSSLDMWTQCYPLSVSQPLLWESKQTDAVNMLEPFWLLKII